MREIKVQEVKDKWIRLAEIIGDAVTVFQRETGFKVEAVKLEHEFGPTSTFPRETKAQIEIKIPN